MSFFKTQGEAGYFYQNQPHVVQSTLIPRAVLKIPLLLLPLLAKRYARDEFSFFVDRLHIFYEAVGEVPKQFSSDWNSSRAIVNRVE